MITPDKISESTTLADLDALLAAFGLMTTSKLVAGFECEITMSDEAGVIGHASGPTLASALRAAFVDFLHERFALMEAQIESVAETLSNAAHDATEAANRNADECVLGGASRDPFVSHYVRMAMADKCSTAANDLRWIIRRFRPGRRKQTG